MLNSFGQKNVVYAASGAGLLCVVGGLWYYRSSVWNTAASWCPWSASNCQKKCNGSKPNGQTQTDGNGAGDGEDTVRQRYSEKTE